MSWQLPVSVKGIIIDKNQVILLKNERNQWELPGGRLEKGETPEQCVTREIQEELGLSCIAKSLLDVWVYEVIQNKHVLIVTYLCECTESVNIKISDEHSAYKWMTLEESQHENMPNGYKHSIANAFILTERPELNEPRHLSNE